MHKLVDTVVSFFEANTPPLGTIFALGPVFLAWAVACLAVAGWLKRDFRWRTGYTRKLFHILIFGTAALLEWQWGTPMVCLFGGMTTLVIGYAIVRGRGNLMYEAMARESDEPHRTYFIVAPYFATLMGGLAGNMVFGSTALIGYLVAGLGDAIGEPIGVRFGKHRYRVPSMRGVSATRSVEGSAAVFLVCSLAGVLGVWLCPTLAFTTTSFAFLAIFGIICALLEAVSPHGWDNLSMQFVPTWLAVLLFGYTT